MTQEIAGLRKARYPSGMPGKQVKNWRTYHALRRKGKSKRSAAKIANSRKRRRR